MLAEQNRQKRVVVELKMKRLRNLDLRSQAEILSRAGNGVASVSAAGDPARLFGPIARIRTLRTVPIHGSGAWACTASRYVVLPTSLPWSPRRPLEHTD